MAETWDETKPAGTRNPKLGDDDIREFKSAVRERCAAEHHWEAVEATPFGESGSQIGLHRKVTLIEQAEDPVPGENERVLYSKDDGISPELFTRGEAAGGEEPGTVRQLTDDGRLHADGGLIVPKLAAAPATRGDRVAIYAKEIGGQLDLFIRDQSDGTEYQLTKNLLGASIPSGETILFEKNTVVHGYVLKTNINDFGVYITKGSAAGGETGGSAKAGASWQQPNHKHGLQNHTHPMPHTHPMDHPHNLPVGSPGDSGSGGYYLTNPTTTFEGPTGPVSKTNTDPGGAGDTLNAAPPSTWRYPGINYTRQTRN